MMKCGHAANGKTEGMPCCVICPGIYDGWNEIGDIPDLSKRKCKCSQCGIIVPSDESISFFEYRPDKTYDAHYNGCKGWE